MSNVRPLVQLEEPQVAPNVRSWRRVRLALVLWLVGCSLAGLLIATWSGEHGSIIFIGLGVFVGVAGAIAHVSLLLTVRFRRLSFFAQLLLLSVFTVALLMAIALAFAASSEGANRYTEALTVAALYASLPAIVAASVFNWLVQHAVA